MRLMNPTTQMRPFTQAFLSAGDKPNASDNMKLLVASLKRKGAVQARKQQKQS